MIDDCELEDGLYIKVSAIPLHKFAQDGFITNRAQPSEYSVRIVQKLIAAKFTVPIATVMNVDHDSGVPFRWLFSGFGIEHRTHYTTLCQFVHGPKDLEGMNISSYQGPKNDGENDFEFSLLRPI
ncbi:MAG: hypothetical protein PHV74_02080 [Dehalococcoidia bacterium]|nr:hypothetical protein [Dehalococcoidia bacterium]